MESVGRHEIPRVIGMVVWNTAVLTNLSALLFTFILSSVPLHALFSPHCRRICFGPLDVASMSGALFSGAHELMLYRVVDDRQMAFVSLTSSQVVSFEPTAFLKTTNNIPHTPDAE